MGYTHYWRRVQEIPSPVFNRIVADFRKLLPILENAGVRLAGPLGKESPEITQETVAFNGAENCGHPKGHEIVIPWPAPDAGGVFAGQAVCGTWFAGDLLATRTCPGDCSYESFVFPRVRLPLAVWDQADANGLWFDFCKTAFRPYDLAVTAFLVIAKHRLGHQIRVTTDGEDAYWFDAKLLCQMHLGFGSQYAVVDGVLNPVRPVEVA